MSKVRELHDKALQSRRPVKCEELAYAIEADEAEAAKGKEFRSLPLIIRRKVDELRGQVPSSLFYMDREMLSWIDTHYPKPKSQAELDAEYLEEHARGCFPETAGKHRAIAKRLREGKST
jgi:hypothetical protein